MTNIINLKSVLIALAILIAASAVVFYVIPQVFDNIPAAEACCGGDGGDGGGGDGGGFTVCEFYPNDPRCTTPTPPTPTPKVPKCDFLNASPSNLPYGGGNVTLSWGTTNVESATINNGVGLVSADGSKIVSVNSTITYVLTASLPNAFGGGYTSDTCSVTVTVQPPVAKPAVCDSFTVNPTSLPYGGGNVTLTWNTTNATSVSINNGIGSVSADGSTTASVNSSKTFTLTAVGAGGNDSCTASVTVQPPVAKPAVCDSFTVNPSSLPYGGGNVTLTWNTTNATGVSINNGIGSVSADGSTTRNVNQTTTFVLTASGAGGNDSCTASVTVQPPVAKPAVCDSFTVNPTSLPYGGGNVTLTWNTTNATSVSINNGIGSVSADGSTTASVNSSKTFTLTAVGAGGNDSCQVTVKVQPKGPAASCDFLNSNDTSLPEGGDTIKLSWGTTNATSVSINNGIGSVSADGSMNVFVDDDTTYVLTASNAEGSDTCSVHIDVEEDRDDEIPRCDFLHVDDDDVDEGDEVTLSWGTTNADDVRINQGVGRVSNDGSKDVRVYDDTTFVLTARNDNGREDTCSVRVEVEEEEDDDEPAPRCDLEVSDDKVKPGDKVTLEWETRHAEELEIEDDHGNEIFETSRSRYFDGEIDVRVYEDTEFTLTVENDEGKRRCRVDVEVEDDNVIVYTKRDQPLVAGIALTQVPYTGFEAGPTLTALFYIILTLWALFVAYVLVIRRGSIFGFSLPQPVDHATVNTEDEFKKKVKMLAAKYSHQPWEHYR